MMEAIKMVVHLPAKAEEVYNAWMDSTRHGEMTGSKANIENSPGGKYSAWEDYITGENLILEPGKRIIQSWRTTKFPEYAQDSQLEIILEEDGNNTKLTLIHTNIPEGEGEKYKKGWEEYYFEPMQKYFQK